jgi:glutathione S-transferase
MEETPMDLTLCYAPMACSLVAYVNLTEAGAPFKVRTVNTGAKEQKSADYLAVNPKGKVPVLLVDGYPLTENVAIQQFIARSFPAAKLLPADSDLALRVRLSDRFYDLYVHEKMQKIVSDRIRPEGQKDPSGVDRARQELEIALALVDRDMGAGGWATGLTFTMADCAAAPALYYANQVAPFGENHPGAARYLDRLIARPSFARVLDEAAPYFDMFPKG